MSSATLMELPTVDFDAAATSDGGLIDLLVAAVGRSGPILRASAQSPLAPGKQLVFMVGPEANRFVLHTHRHHFSHAEGWSPVLGEGAGQGLLNMDDPTHSAHRRIWNPAFGRAMMEGYIPVMQGVIERRCADWAARGEVDLLVEAREITFEVAAVALAGIDAPDRIARLREMFYSLMHGIPSEEYDSAEAWTARYNALQSELVGTLQLLIEQRRVQPADSRGEDVLARIIDARDDDGDTLTDLQLIGHLNILLLAGHETTTSLGGWTLYKIAQGVGGAAQVRAELERGETGPARWLDAFIREVGRLYPPVINVPRGVTTPFEFGGYEIPPGTPVRLAIGASGRLPTVFRDPERFEPARFLPPREEDRVTPYGLVTFGGGPRICIGINFAQIEVRELVRHVLARYELVPMGPEPAHGGYWSAEVPGGLPVRVSAR